jgi:hypothetical protein
MKTLSINGSEVVCSHAVRTDPQTNHTAVHLTVSVGGLQSEHRLTIGAIDEPLPVGYDAAQLQKDLDAFRQKSAEMLEGKYRAKKIAAELV